jgi:hypothetical protein
MRIKRLQLTLNSSFQSIRGTVLAAGAAPQRWRSALLGAAEPHSVGQREEISAPHDRLSPLADHRGDFVLAASGRAVVLV